MRLFIHAFLVFLFAPAFLVAKNLDLPPAQRQQIFDSIWQKVGQVAPEMGKLDKRHRDDYQAYVIANWGRVADAADPTEEYRKVLQEVKDSEKNTEMTPDDGANGGSSKIFGRKLAMASLVITTSMEVLDQYKINLGGQKISDITATSANNAGVTTGAGPVVTVSPPPAQSNVSHGPRPSVTPVTDEAVKIGNQFNTTNYPNEPAVWRDLALQDMAAHRYRDAFYHFGRALGLDKRDPDTLFGYGSAAYNLGDTRLAARSASMALEIDPANKGALTLLKLTENRTPTVTLPNVLDATNKPGDLNMTPNAGSDNQSHVMGSAFTGMSPAEIAAEAQRQVNAPPSAVEQSVGMTQQAAQAMNVRDYSKAKDILTQAVALNGRNAEAYNSRAIAENKLGQYRDAIHDASFALGLIPGNAAALQTRSWAFAQAGQYKEALADANYSLERDPRNAYAFYNRAFALAGIQDRDGAVDSLQKAANLDHRFQQTYQQALQAPKDSDLVFLFSDVGAQQSAPGAASSPAGRKQRFTRIMLISILGGGLVALGLLHIFSPRWRQTVNATLRRLTGAAAPAGEAASPDSDGFWSGYTVTREIGSGGMGIVYEATDNALARRVAIKKLRDEVRSDPEERRRFLTEARTVAALHHPNIVDIYSIVEDSGEIYLVFEYVDGRTVHQLLVERGPLALVDAQRIMRDVCEAVSYAHQQGVIHRDLKPSNIMLASEGKVKVMDFGVARQVQEALTKAAQTNTIVGTPPYMAPEQEQGTVRRESDIFALGVCFYELVSGRLPFVGQGSGMLLNKMNGQHVPLSQVVSGLPAGLDAVVAKALAADPEQRYRTPGEFSSALQGLQS